MIARSWHTISMEQGDAAEVIEAQTGLEAFFDYTVSEKLLKYVEATSQCPDFARDLPRIVSRVRSMINVEEIQTHGQRIERQGPAITVQWIRKFVLWFAPKHSHTKRTMNDCLAPCDKR